jgi:outer membrane receptor protein involved in Fe transport
VPNAPEHLFALRAAAPVVPGLFVASTRVSVEGPRWDRHDRAADPAQQQTDAALLWDVVLSGRAERWGLRYNLGVYNVFDWRYSTPVSTEFGALTAVPQNGRTFLASASVEY